MAGSDRAFRALAHAEPDVIVATLRVLCPALVAEGASVTPDDLEPTRLEEKKRVSSGGSSSPMPPPFGRASGRLLDDEPTRCRAARRLRHSLEGAACRLCISR